MRLSIVSDLIAHARFEKKLPTILELGVEFALETQDNVSFHAPVICQITGRILDHSDADSAEILGTPVCDTCLAFMHCSLY